MTDFNFENVLVIYQSTDAFPVSFELGWEWLLFSRKDSAKRSFESCGFVEGTDFIRFHQNVESGAVTRELEFIQMTIDCFKSWAMMVGTERGKEVRKYFLECEKELKKRKDQQENTRSIIRQEIREVIAPELEEIRRYKKACDDHKGTGSVIQSDVDDKEYPVETITIHQYCRQKGIEPSVWLTISKRYGQFVRVGTKTEPPKSKGKLLVYGHLYYYAEAALKSVLDID